jgi:hypothetical protein
MPHIIFEDSSETHTAETEGINATAILGRRETISCHDVSGLERCYDVTTRCYS